MCDFFDLYRVYKWIDFALEEVLSKLLPPSASNPDPTKTAFSEFFFLKNAIDVSVTSSCVQMMTQITESKKPTSRTFWKRFSISIKLLHKLSCKKWCLHWRMKCSWGTCPLIYLFRSAFAVNFDRSQLIHSVKSAKCRKGSQRISLSFTWLEKYQ